MTGKARTDESSVLVPIVDSWFGIATTPAITTQLYNHTGPVHNFSRTLSTTQCTTSESADEKPLAGQLEGLGGLEYLTCNLHRDTLGDTYGIAPYLVGPEEATRLAQGPTASNMIRNFTDAGGISYHYLADPEMDGKLDFKASTFAVSSQCRPITKQCLPGVQWPVIQSQPVGGDSFNNYFNFSCSEGFKANFTFSGLVQALDADPTQGGIDAVTSAPTVGMAFASDHDLSRRVGQYYDNFTGVVTTLPGFNITEGAFDLDSAVLGSNWSYQYILPKNPLNFAVWASGYPTFDGKTVESDPSLITNPLLNDTEIFYQSGFTYWMVGCEATVYDVTYTWVNGSVHTFNATASSEDMGALISAPFAFQLGQVVPVLSSIANLAGTQNTSSDLANTVAEGWSSAALALSVGVLDPAPNSIEQVRNSTIAVARVPMIPLYLLLGFKAIYVIAVIALAIGAYCFTHPGETEEVKAQLSAKGLAAAHFDDPGLLQQNVVKELNSRLQKGQDDSKPSLQRAQTAPVGHDAAVAPSDKRVGLVAQADGAWKFAIVADGVWHSVKPIAVNLLTMEAASGQMGTAGAVINAWK